MSYQTSHLLASPTITQTKNLLPFVKSPREKWSFSRGFCVGLTLDAYYDAVSGHDSSPFAGFNFFES